MRPALLLVLLAAPAAAQPVGPRALTLGAGSGPGLGRTHHWAMYATHQRGSTIWTAQFAAHDLRRNVFAHDYTQDVGAVEAGVLVGRSVQLPARLEASASAGVAAVRVLRSEPACRLVYDGRYIHDRSCMPFQGEAPTDAWTVGVPLEAAVFAHIEQGLGVGLRAFATVNPEAAFGGFAVDLRIRPLPRRR